MKKPDIGPFGVVTLVLVLGVDALLAGLAVAGINAVGAVLASAIDDAVGIPGAVTQLPVTPQRMREMLRKRGR